MTNANNLAHLPINRCHLYRFRSPHALAIRLGVSVEKLRSLAETGRYKVFTLEGGRAVQEPEKILQVLHRKIHRYLARIEVPEYLHSAIKGRSYISNASAHIGSGRVVKVDVKNFFTSVPQWRVMHFFRDRLECTSDVAGLLANLICREGKLATGSSASPIISYYAYKDMFDAMDALARQRGHTLTVYVDDVTLSGPNVSFRDLIDLHVLIKRFGLVGHKSKISKPGQTAIVTGIAVTPTGIALPNARWKKIRATIRLYNATEDDETRAKILNQLVSMLYEATQIQPELRGFAERYHSKLRETRMRLKLAA